MVVDMREGFVLDIHGCAMMIIYIYIYVEYGSVIKENVSWALLNCV